MNKKYISPTLRVADIETSALISNSGDLVRFCNMGDDIKSGEEVSADARDVSSHSIWDDEW